MSFRWIVHTAFNDYARGDVIEDAAEVKGHEIHVHKQKAEAPEKEAAVTDQNSQVTDNGQPAPTSAKTLDNPSAQAPKP